MVNRNSYDRLVLAAAQKIKERDYWLNQLSGHLEKSTFPYDLNYKRAHSNQVDLSENQKPPLDRVNFQFPPSLAAKAIKLSNSIDIKLHMILVTGLIILLHKYSGNLENDVIIGSPILKQKTDREFINRALVFRNRTDDHMLFKELLLNVRETIINANENQNYPIEILANQLKLPITRKEFPLFNIVLQMENLHDKAYIQDIPYKMLFSFLRTGEEIQGGIEHNSLLYREPGIKTVIRYYLHVLEQALDNVNIPLSRIQLMSQPERNRVLFDFNRTKRERETGYPGDKTLHEIFTRQVEKAPDNIALAGPRQTPQKHEEKYNRSYGSFSTHLSYKELNEKSTQLAYLLKQRGVQADTIVGIMVEPTIEMMIGLLAILKAGGAYLPLDPDYPQERKQYMLDDSNVKVLLTTPELYEQLNAKGKLINLTQANESSPSTLTSACQVSPTNLAYIIYTSGTTGKPKGVMVEHANIIAYTKAFHKEFAISHRDTVIQLNSFAFDAFVEEVFPLLLTGGKIVIPGISEMIDINLLSRLILKHDVTIVDCTPLLLNEFNRLTADNLENVRLFISGGDILKAEYVDKLITMGKVYNTYGPTETTVCATYYRCQPVQPPAGFSTIPIGKPVSNYYTYIMGKNQQPLPVGISGELYISGPGVARGYLNNPELTAEKFDRDLWDLHDYHDGIYRSYRLSYKSYTLYRTGDLARWHPDGNIEYMGRIDHQVKIRGYRIELQGIESHLLSHPKIKKAVVIAREDETNDKYLCAYVVPEAAGREKQPIHTALREYMSKQLPAYMVPAYIVPIDSIPLNRSGKVDKSKLPAPGVAHTFEYAPPVTIMEKNLAAVFSHLLNTNIEKIGINDDFFELGGNSLKLIKLTTQIQEQFNIHIPLNHILKNCSIKELSKLIVNKRFTSIEDEAVVLLNQAKGGNIFFFPPGIGYAIAYMEFALLLENHSVYAFNYIDDNNILETYTENIMQIQPTGSLLLSAYSAGGRLCLKAAEILEKKGRNVSDIILMECFRYPKKLEKQEIEEMAKKFSHDFKNRLIELGLQSLTVNAVQTIKNYSKFLDSLTDLKPVAANIHFIKAGDKKHMKEPGGWETLTRNKYTVYTGFGKHELMLAPGAIEKNAAIINKILNKEIEAHDSKSKN